jgi:hypothetical protein
MAMKGDESSPEFKISHPRPEERLPTKTREVRLFKSSRDLKAASLSVNTKVFASDVPSGTYREAHTRQETN